MTVGLTMKNDLCYDDLRPSSCKDEHVIKFYQIPLPNYVCQNWDFHLRSHGMAHSITYLRRSRIIIYSLGLVFERSTVLSTSCFYRDGRIL